MKGTCIEYIDMATFSLYPFSNVSVSFACHKMLGASGMDTRIIIRPCFLLHLLLLPPLHHCPSLE